MVSCARKVRNPLYTRSSIVEIVVSDMNFLRLRVLPSLAVFFSLMVCKPNLPYSLFLPCRCSIDGSGLQFCSRSFSFVFRIIFFNLFLLLSYASVSLHE